MQRLPPPGPVELAVDDKLVLTATLDGKAHTLKPGQSAVLSVRAGKIRVEELARFVTKLYEDATGKKPDQKEVLAAVKEQFHPDEAGVVVIDSRLSVAYAGPVKVSEVDIAERLAVARRAAGEGPYELAEEELELVLEAVPQNEEARRLLRMVSARLERGAEPGRLRGRLVFPAGMPDEATKKLWKETHEGFVTVTPLDGAKGETFGAPVKDGRFEVLLPQGLYALQVNVPGFGPGKKDVRVGQKTEVAVEVVR